MKAILNREAMKIAYAAAVNDSHRPVLEYVRIGDGEIAAADGFILARRPVQTTPKEGGAVLVLARTILEYLEEGCKELTITTDRKKKLHLSARKGHGKRTITTDLCTLKFPSYKQVVHDAQKSETASITGFTLSILVQALKILDRDGETQHFSLNTKTDRSPVILKPHNPTDTTYVLVMPCALLGGSS